MKVECRQSDVTTSLATSTNHIVSLVIKGIAKIIFFMFDKVGKKCKNKAIEEICGSPHAAAVFRCLRPQGHFFEINK